MSVSPVTSFTRLAALAASVVITFVTVISMALIGHPREESGAVLAKSPAARPVATALTTVANR